MHHPDRPFGRDAVEIGAAHAPRAEIDRVESPADDRLRRIGERLLGLAQAFDDRLDRGHARPDAAIRVHAVVIADVDVGPHRAFEQVAVALDQAGHQHLVGEARVEPVRAPAGEVVEAAGAEDAAVAYRDVRRLGAGRVHREDALRAVDRDHAALRCEADESSQRPPRGIGLPAEHRARLR